MFYCLKVIKPLWYFHLNCGDDILWPDPENLLLSGSFDCKYDSNESTISDASFVILMQGHIQESVKTKYLKRSIIDYEHSLYDEFRFLKKFFNPLWSIIYLIYCIFSFRNTIKVFSAFIKTFNIKRDDIYNNQLGKKVIDMKDQFYNKKDKINVRIVIPTYNRYEVLKNLLLDLEKQDYKNFFITIIDQSEDYNKDFYNVFKININLIRQEKPALWKARNDAIKNSNEEIIALLDDDSRIKPNWLSKHLACLDYFKVNISAGVSISESGAKVPSNYHYYRISDQLDTGNVVFTRKVISKCGFFDEQFEAMRMGDAEFGLRAYKKGIISISNPEAQRLHLKTSVGGLRQSGSWDAFRPTNIFKPRPIPSVLYYARNYFGDYNAFIFLLINIPLSFTSYSNKTNFFSLLISISIFLIFLPIIFCQTIYSWKLSSNIILDGHKIPK